MKTTTINVKDVQEQAWLQVKASAALESKKIGTKLSEILSEHARLKSLLGFPRDADMDNVEFRLVPHRTDDSKDDVSVWVWKLQTFVDGEINDVHLL